MKHQRKLNIVQCAEENYNHLVKEGALEKSRALFFRAKNISYNEKGVIHMTKIRIVAEIDDDIFDELCSYPQDRVNILIAEDAIIPKEESRINYDEEES